MLTKGNVQFFVNNGFMDITAHTLDAAHSYKVVKFKNVLREINRGITSMEESFYKELGIDENFSKRFDELLKKEKLTKEEQKELDKFKETDKRFGEMRNTMLKEEADLKEVKAMPYGEWKKLQDENKDRKLNYYNQSGQMLSQREFLMAFESELEGILWNAPTEE